MPDLDAEGQARYEWDAGIFKRIATLALLDLLRAVQAPLPNLNAPDLPATNAEWTQVLSWVSDEFLNGQCDQAQTLAAVQGALPTAPRYVLIIDEINRGNISKIFGELITLIEDDKRYPNEEYLVATLPYTRQRFVVPANLYILGTMNSADKSIALVDVALRRRFDFVELTPRFDVCWPDANNRFRRVLKELNDRLEVEKDRDHRIGHAFFMGIGADPNDQNNVDAFNRRFHRKVRPLLAEYFYNNSSGLKKVLNGNDSMRFIKVNQNRWDWEDNIDTFDCFAALDANFPARAQQQQQPDGGAGGQAPGPGNAANPP